MMHGTIERAWFILGGLLGSLLRFGRYSTVRVVADHGERRVQKYRRFYAPFLIRIGGPLMRLLDTGVRVLPQRDWQERERRLYWTIYGSPVRIDPDGTLFLPCLAGRSLASILEDRAIPASVKTMAIEQAAVALAAFHRRGFTHGDAMAENVMIDLEHGSARWFDFETMHEPHRREAWRCADDVRALLVTCLRRTPRERHEVTIRSIVNAYGDDEVAAVLAANFRSALRRPLPFHLAQAALPFSEFREIGRLLRQL